MSLGGVVPRAWERITDEAYVISTWMRAHRDMSPRSLRSRDAMNGYRRDVMRRLGEHGAVVACDPEHPTTLHGFACGEPGLLHFVYVTKDLRCLGLGRQLIEASTGGYPDRLEVTHRWPWPTSRFVLRIERGRAA